MPRKKTLKRAAIGGRAEGRSAAAESKRPKNVLPLSGSLYVMLLSTEALSRGTSCGLKESVIGGRSAAPLQRAGYLRRVHPGPDATVRMEAGDPLRTVPGAYGRRDPRTRKEVCSRPAGRGDPGPTRPAAAAVEFLRKRTTREANWRAWGADTQTRGCEKANHAATTSLPAPRAVGSARGMRRATPNSFVRAIHPGCPRLRASRARCSDRARQKWSAMARHHCRARSPRTVRPGSSRRYCPTVRSPRTTA